MVARLLAQEDRPRSFVIVADTDVAGLIVTTISIIRSHGSICSHGRIRSHGSIRSDDSIGCHGSNRLAAKRRLKSAFDF